MYVPITHQRSLRKRRGLPAWNALLRATGTLAVGLAVLIPPSMKASGASSPAPSSVALPVIPGAQGFGVTTPGGRGGKVIKVTTLADSGPGSLREALYASEPRVVVFEVGGIIWLEKDLTIRNPYVTIAGQTAPSPGITLARATFRVQTHDVLIQHLYIRPGDRITGYNNGLAVIGKVDGSDDVYNVVIDHCSISWAINKSLSIWVSNDPLPAGAKPVHDVTVRASIISESLRYPDSGNHMGFLIGDHSQRIAAIGNLFAHNSRRNPAPFGRTSSVIANNLIYNPGDGAIHLVNHNQTGPLISSVVGNVILAGADTVGYGDRVQAHSYLGESRIYLEDNLAPAPPSVPESVLVSQKPIWVEGLTPLPGDRVTDWVLRDAGARPWDRDAVDRRIVSDVIHGTGRIIDSQDEVGGWMQTTPTRWSLDLPENPSGDDDGDGYTNAEEWIFSFEKPVPPLPGQTFADVPPEHWAFDDVQALAEGGYVAGCDPGTWRYCPQDPMTRAEAAVFVVRGLQGVGHIPQEPAEAPFSDVPLGTWFAKWVDALALVGFTAGCGEAVNGGSLFCPLGPHTRAEAAVFFLRMELGADFSPDPPTEQTYEDVPVGDSAPWYAKWVYAAHERGLTADCEDDANRGDGRFRPDAVLTRAEAACMMARALRLR